MILLANITGVAIGVVLIYYQSTKSYVDVSNTVNYYFGAPYYSISLSLNIILTLMIVIRLIMHSRNIRNALGPLAQVSGLYRTIVTMLIESCALYGISILLFIGTWAAGSAYQLIFFPILAEIQVRMFFFLPLAQCDLETGL